MQALFIIYLPGNKLLDHMDFCSTFVSETAIWYAWWWMDKKSHCRLQISFSLYFIWFEFRTPPPVRLHLLFWILDLDPSANFFNPFLDLIFNPSGHLLLITCPAVLPANVHTCSCFCFFYILFLPFIKVCHCCLCSPNIFPPLCPSPLSTLSQYFADAACVSCQYGAFLSAQLDCTHLLFSYQDLQDVAMEPNASGVFLGEYR